MIEPHLSCKKQQQQKPYMIMKTPLKLTSQKMNAQFDLTTSETLVGHWRRKNKKTLLYVYVVRGNLSGARDANEAISILSGPTAI